MQKVSTEVMASPTTMTAPTSGSSASSSRKPGMRAGASGAKGTFATGFHPPRGRGNNG